MITLPALIELGRAAGAVVGRHFEAGCSVSQKADASPVTAADHEAEALIIAGLARFAPDVPVVAEEEVAAGRVPIIGERFFLVDPLDGTREFVRGGHDFTVNIALIEGGAPVLGVVVAPMLDQVFAGDVVRQRALTIDGEGERPIRVRDAPAVLRAVASRSHADATTEAWLAASGISERVSVGSSLKFCLVASGKADVYPRATSIMEWDTAAGDAVLRAAGGRVVDPDGVPLRYGKPYFRSPPFVASGSVQVPLLRPFL